MRWFFSLGLIWIISNSPIFAQNLKFKTYQVEDGLSNNSVNDFENDASGGLWIATWDGLNFFDGMEFKVYKHQPENSNSLPSNFIYSLQVDHNNTLWVKSSKNSVSYKEGEGFTNFYFDSDVENIGLNVQGNLYIEVQGKLYEFEGEEFTLCDSCVIVEKSSNSISDLLLETYPQVEISDVLSDEFGQVWLATMNQGLFLLDTDAPGVSNLQFLNYTPDAFNSYSISSKEIYTLHEDVFGNIWIGYKDGGISMAYKYSDEIYSIYRHPTENPLLPEETVRAITQGKNGEIWLGYYNSGLFRRKNEKEKVKKFTLEKSKENSDWNRVRSLFTDHLGNIWVGTYAGIAKINVSGQIQYFDQKSTANIPNHRNYDFAEEKDGSAIWVACWGGLAKYDFKTEQFISFEGQKELEPYHIRNILSTNGKLYLATENNGVILFEAGQLDFLTEEDGLLSSSIFSIEEDEDSKNIWIATMGGISIYHPDKGIFYKINESDGLVSQLVYGILSGDENMWASTTYGIAKINKKNFKVRVLSPTEGWQGAEFSEGGFYKNDLGYLFFGGVNGVNYFHSKKLKLRDELPMIGIEKPEKSKFEDQLKTGRVELNIHPIGFNTFTGNRIQYKLIPILDEWTDLKDDFRIVESSLPSGDYTLQVRNSLQDNPSSYSSLSFTVPRHFLQSPMFWLALALVLFLLILTWRNRSAKIQKRILQQKIEERTKLIQQQKLELEKINHDLDTKNKEVSEQKAALLNLHHRHKDSDFEIDQFKNYMLGQLKLPLSELKENIEQLTTKSRARKEGVLHQLNEMIVQISDWDRVSSLERFDDYGKSLTLLNPLLEEIFQNIVPKLNQYQIDFSRKFQLKESWIELDVIRFKLFWQYLLREILKYLEEQASIQVFATSDTKLIQVQLKVFSQLLTSNLEEITKFSPYLKEAYSLLKNLGGELTYFSENDCLFLTVTFPIEEAEKTISKPTNGKWKYLNIQDELDPNKHHVVLLGKKFESDSLMKIIRSSEFDITVEEDVNLVIEIIRNAPIHALIIYNEKISQNIIELINATKKSNQGGTGHIPVVYIYDNIESGFQDKLMDLGIETFIQLPASSNFILKNISTQLQNIKRFKREIKASDLLVDQTSNFTSPNEKLVKEGLAIINNQITNANFKVESLSEALGVSKIKCYRAFKEVLNMSPSDLMISLKIEKAQQLLSKNKMNVSEVSFACGFNDPKYFSKIFKKHTGQSPKNFHK